MMAIRRSVADERGATAVEFAVVLPLLMLLLFGIIEFGMTFWRAQSLEAAAREGARIASLSQSTRSDITAAVDNAIGGAPFASAPTVAVTPDQSQPCNLRSGQTVTVTVNAPVTIEIPLWGSRSLTLTGEGRFRCE